MIPEGTNKVGPEADVLGKGSHIGVSRLTLCDIFDVTFVSEASVPMSVMSSQKIAPCVDVQSESRI